MVPWNSGLGDWVIHTCTNNCETDVYVVHLLKEFSRVFVTSNLVISAPPPLATPTWVWSHTPLPNMVLPHMGVTLVCMVSHSGYSHLTTSLPPHPYHLTLTTSPLSPRPHQLTFITSPSPLSPPHPHLFTFITSLTTSLPLTLITSRLSPSHPRHPFPHHHLTPSPLSPPSPPHYPHPYHLTLTTLSPLTLTI